MDNLIIIEIIEKKYFLGYKKIFSFMFINFIIINNKKKRIIKTVIFK